MPRTRAGRAILAALGAVAFGVPSTPATADPRSAWLEPINDAIPGSRGPWFRRPFDTVATDVDLDGDPDLLINWHHVEPLELWRNDGGRFVLESDAAALGFVDSPGVPTLYTASEPLEARIRAGGRPGLYLWHQPPRTAEWELFWLDPEDRHGGLRLEFETSLKVIGVEGLAEGEVQRPPNRILAVAIASDVRERRFQVRTLGTGIAVTVRATPGRAGANPTVYAGAELEAFAEGEVTVWKDDPHGAAWIDVEGSRHPELFFTRGGLGGKLVPPASPKTDRFYLHHIEGAASQYSLAADGRVPSGYGRGRRVEWVDADGDGQLDLSIANERSPNVLLVRDAAGTLHDRAPALGLDVADGAAQLWTDFDGDGQEDLLLLEGAHLTLAQRRGGRYIRVPAPGASLPERGAQQGLIDPTALRLADVDRDGDLDLWVLSYAGDRSQHLFRREGAGFIDASVEMGLGAARGHGPVALLDVDDDGYLDAVSFGRRALLWHNQKGERFEFIPLPRAVVGQPIHAATTLDADGDGRTDLALIGRRRHLLRNVADSGNGRIEVILQGQDRPPIGALVTAIYDDGGRLVQRYGSAHSTAYSQSLQPLHFGVPAGSRLEAIEVRWPGEATSEIHPVDQTLTPTGDAGGAPRVRTLRLERRGAR